MSRSAIAIAIVLVAAGTAVAKPKVALVPIDGDRDGEVADVVGDALGDDVAIVGSKEVNRTVERLGIDGEMTDKDLKKLATELDADAVVQGRLDKKGGSRVLHVKMFVHGKRAKGFKIEFATAKSSKFKQALHDKVVEKVGVGDGDDDRPKAKKKKAADDDADKVADDDKPKAKAKKKKVADDDADKVADDDKPKAKAKKKKAGDDEAGDDTPKAKKKKAGDDDADKVGDDDKPKAKKRKAGSDDDTKVAAKADTGDDDKPKAKKKTDDDDKIADKGDDAPKAKKKKTARRDDDDGVVEVRARGDSGGAAARPANRAAVRAEIGPSFANRSLTFVSRQVAGETPTDYSNSVVPGLRVSGEVYPLALSAPTSAAAGLGLAGDFDQTLALTIQSTDNGMVTKAAVTQRHFDIGARYRFVFGQAPTSPSLAVGVDYGGRQFKVDRSQLMGTTVAVPDSYYTYVAPGATVRFPFTPVIAFALGGRGLLLTGAGAITTAGEYGQAKVTGVDASAGFDFVFAKHYVVRLSADFVQIGFAFSGNGLLSQDSNGQPLVGGATDRSIGGALTVGGVY